MPPAISAFGAFHTAISLVPVPLGLYLLLRYGQIDPLSVVGKWYVATMAIGSVTGLMIYHHGGFGPGHVLSVLTLALLLAGVMARRGAWFGGKAPYAAAVCMSLTYFLLLFFLTTETLTRVPPAHPFAPSQEAHELLPVRGVLLAMLIVGVGFQLITLRRAAASAAAGDRQ